MLKLPEWTSIDGGLPCYAGARSPLVATPMAPECELSVIIPARDERDTIGDALNALATQRDADGSRVDRRRYEVLVLANNCDDDTALVARAARTLHPSLSLHVVEMRFGVLDAHIGIARRVLMDEAARRFRERGRSGGVIASTDADTRVAPDWVARTLTTIAGGADAVGGRIVVEHSAECQREPISWTYHLRDVGYRLLATELVARVDPDEHDPWPRHFQHFGPSLAVTAEAYERAGGLPPLPALEDVALYRSLRRIDARLRHDPHVRVMTSSRLSRRTVFGFAAQLCEWSRMGGAGIPLMVASPAAIDARAQAYRQLRMLLRDARAVPERSVGHIARQLAVDADLCAALLASAPTLGCLLEQIEALQEFDGAWARRWPDIDIRDAIAGLRERLVPMRMAGSAGDAFQQVEPVSLPALSEPMP
ncbi:MAG TPA: glycosyltransferase [Thermomicrobiales bacterium]|nr:glycosyltransferase [Thermomicrobiales bacterium]